MCEYDDEREVDQDRRRDQLDVKSRMRTDLGFPIVGESVRLAQSPG